MLTDKQEVYVVFGVIVLVLGGLSIIRWVFGRTTAMLILSIICFFSMIYMAVLEFKEAIEENEKERMELIN